MCMHVVVWLCECVSVCMCVCVWLCIFVGVGRLKGHMHTHTHTIHAIRAHSCKNSHHVMYRHIYSPTQITQNATDSSLCPTYSNIL